MLKFFKQHTWQALAVTFGGASTWKAGLSAAPTYNTKHCLHHYTNRVNFGRFLITLKIF